jgi:hypothetical protein
VFLNGLARAAELRESVCFLRITSEIKSVKGRRAKIRQKRRLENLNCERFFKMATTQQLATTCNGHGGARDGAGRRPKALRYASELTAAEGKLMSALPSAVAALVSAAESGDVSAAKYLLDRAFGRVTAQSVPVAENVEPPICEADAEAEEKRRELSRLIGW